MKKFLLSVSMLVVFLTAIQAQTEVTVAEAGTLRQLVEEPISEINSLKVKGPINGTDLRFLRELCGISVSGGPSNGRLTDLDLSEARIVAGGDYYMYDYSTYEEFFTSNDELGIYAFFNCPVIESITLPSTLKKVGTSAFSSCAHLGNIEVPETNETFYSIDGSLYSRADAKLIKYPQSRNLRHFIVPEGTKIIGYDAISDALSLELVTLPEGLTTIERTAFCFSNNITNIDIPSTVTSIGVSAFNYCAGLESLNVVEGNSVYTSVDGIIYTKDMTTLFRCPLKRLTDVNIPASVTKLEEYAFSSCTKINNITMPEGLLTISDWAFDGCRNLEVIDIPSTVTTIGNGAFSSCNKVKSLILPDAVKRIGRWLFYDCTALTEVKFADDLLSIGEGAFQSCTSLTSLVIPSKVNTVVQQTFYGCQALKEITLPKALTLVGAYAFYGCKALENVTIYAETPPSCQTFPFYQVPVARCTLTVPYGTSEDYRNAIEWKNFANIVEMENTSINNVTVETDSQWYTIDGKALLAPQKGINIMRMTDGTTRKVMK